MKEDPIDECGLSPFTFRGWMLKYCRAHDEAYKKDSEAQRAGLTQLEMDQSFKREALRETLRPSGYAFENLASLPRRVGKRIMAYAAYGVIRTVTKFLDLYEGRK